MATISGQGLINEALFNIGVLADGETPSPGVSNTALISLNNLLESWSVERLDVYAIVVADHTLIANQATYAIGQEGTPDFNAQRPTSIRSAAIVTATDGFVFPVKLVPAEEFNSIPEPLATAKVPRVLWNDNSYPNANLSLWPIPSAANKLRLYTWQPLTQLSSLTATFDFPPAYQRAIILNLAVELAPKLQRPLDPTLASIAMAAKEALRGLNAPPVQGAAEEAQASGVAQPVPPGPSVAQPK